MPVEPGGIPVRRRRLEAADGLHPLLGWPQAMDLPPRRTWEGERRGRGVLSYCGAWPVSGFGNWDGCLPLGTEVRSL